MPEAPRDASTVVLVRDAAGSSGVEVFLMRRHAQVGFLGGMHLFPGGKVDAPDGSDISIWFPGQARQRLHEISTDVWELTFASHASGAAVVGFNGNATFGEDEDPFILRWSKGNARRRVRENFPGTSGAPDVVVGPDGSPWLMVRSEVGESHEQTRELLREMDTLAQRVHTLDVQLSGVLSVDDLAQRDPAMRGIA